MYKKFLVTLFLLSLLLGGFMNLASAQTEPLNVLQGAYPGIGPGGATPERATITLYIGGIIKIALDFLGIVLLVIILYGGYLWMTAGGNEEQIKKAKAWITNGVIGVVIVIAAYVVSYFVIQQLSQIGITTTETPTP